MTETSLSADQNVDCITQRDGQACDRPSSTARSLDRGADFHSEPRFSFTHLPAEIRSNILIQLFTDAIVPIPVPGNAALARHRTKALGFNILFTSKQVHAEAKQIFLVNATFLSNTFRPRTTNWQGWNGKDVRPMLRSIQIFSRRSFCSNPGILHAFRNLQRLKLVHIKGIESTYPLAFSSPVEAPIHVSHSCIERQWFRKQLAGWLDILLANETRTGQKSLVIFLTCVWFNEIYGFNAPFLRQRPNTEWNPLAAEFELDIERLRDIEKDYSTGPCVAETFHCIKSVKVWFRKRRGGGEWRKVQKPQIFKQGEKRHLNGSKSPCETDETDDTASPLVRITCEGHEDQECVR